MCAEKIGEQPEVPWTVEWAAKKLGLPARQVRALRDAMAEGTDFRAVPHGSPGRREVVFTASGLRKLAETVKQALEFQIQAPAQAKHTNGHPAWAVPPEAVWRPFTPDPVTVVIFRRRMMNPHVVEGELEDGRVVRLRIKPSPQWRAGMRLPSVQIGDGFYEFHGRPPVAQGIWR